MRSKTLYAGFAALAALAALTIACGSGGKDTTGPGAQNPATTAAAKGKKIVLEVTGPTATDITYGLGSDQSQENGAKLPWKKELASNETLIIATLLAQSKGTGKIGCKVTIDGKVAKENTSTGQFAVVTCTADNT